MSGLGVIIIGAGHIGSELAKEYKRLYPDLYDPNVVPYNIKSDEHYKFAFITVDTPAKDDGSCDISQVKDAIFKTSADIYVIRSTVFPKTTENLIKESGKKIVYSPEFYGCTKDSSKDTYNFDFTILGGDKETCNEVVQLLQYVYSSKHRFIITDNTTAELAKYMENTMLATKLSMCIQFYQLAKDLGVSYPELREIFLQDERFTRSHTFVYEYAPYWDSHCFNKDLRAISTMDNAWLIRRVVDFNKMCKENEKENQYGELC